MIGERNVVIDFKTLKALSVEARLSVLRALEKKPRTLTDLAEELGLKPSTLKEHLEKLTAAGLVEREDTKRKWKYYALTQKGRDVVEPKERRVLFSLFASIALGLVSGYMFLRGFFEKTQEYTAAPKTADAGIMQAEEEAANATADMAARTAESAAPVLDAWAILFFIALVLVGVSIGYLLRKRMVR